MNHTLIYEHDYDGGGWFMCSCGEMIMMPSYGKPPPLRCPKAETVEHIVNRVVAKYVHALNQLQMLELRAELLKELTS